MKRKPISIPDEWLSPEAAESIVIATVNAIAERDTEADSSWKAFRRDYCSKCFTAAYRATESPIEKRFLLSLATALITTGRVFEMHGRCKDYLFEAAHQREQIFRLSCCRAFYGNLPDDARPDQYREFLEIIDGPDERRDEIVFATFLYLDLGGVFNPHFATQATLDLGGKRLRVDGVMWCPAAGDGVPAIVVECDGFDYHSDRSRFHDDRVRDRLLADNGFLVRRYSGSEINNDPASVALDLLGAYETHIGGSDKHKVAWFRRVLEDKSSHPTEDLIEYWREWKAS